MDREGKAAVVEKIAERVSEADAIFAVDYRGINVPQIGNLRSELREADASFHIVKNTLTKRAVESSGKGELTEFLTGPTAFTFIRGDIALAAKALNKLVKDEQVIEFKGGLMDGELLTAEQIQSIAKLPSAAVLQGQLVGMLSSPLTVLVRGLNSMIGGLATALAQLQEQKASEAPSEPEPEPEPEAVTEPVEAEAKPAPEPEVEVEPEAEAETEPEPEAETAEPESTGASEPSQDDAETKEEEPEDSDEEEKEEG